MIRVLAAAATSLLLATACANTDPGAADTPGAPNAVNTASRQCFFANSANGFAAVDTRTVNVRVGAGDVYRLNLMNACRDINWTNRMALTTRGSSSICTGTALGTTLVTRGPTGVQRCAVRSVALLSPQEVEALRPRERP